MHQVIQDVSGLGRTIGVFCYGLACGRVQDVLERALQIFWCKISALYHCDASVCRQSRGPYRLLDLAACIIWHKYRRTAGLQNVERSIVAAQARAIVQK
jgi:hypothetical protein